MGCRSCGGGSDAPPDPNRGITGSWALRWPHGPLQKFSSEEAARAYMDARPHLAFTLLPPAEPEQDA